MGVLSAYIKMTWKWPNFPREERIKKDYENGLMLGFSNPTENENEEVEIAAINGAQYLIPIPENKDKIFQ